MKARAERKLLIPCQVVTLRIKVGVAAHCECCLDSKWTIVIAEIRHDRIHVDVYNYIDLCAATKYLLDAHKSQGLHVSQ